MIREIADGGYANDSWVTDSSVPDPDPLPRINPYLILIRPLKVKEQSKGGILLPETFTERADYLATVGRILSVGELAYHDDDVWPRAFNKVGDIVVYPKFGGEKLRYKGVSLVLFKPYDIKLTVDSPQDIDPMFQLG